MFVPSGSLPLLRVPQDSVIGLAWVSGMCHPEYSCTINEGNNFESVFVIAHEMVGRLPTS